MAVQVVAKGAQAGAKTAQMAARVGRVTQEVTRTARAGTQTTGAVQRGTAVSQREAFRRLEVGRKIKERVEKSRREASRGEAEKMEGGIPLPIGIMLIIFAVLLDILDLLEGIPIIGTIIALMISAGGIILWILYWLAGARGLAKAIIMLLAYIAEIIPAVGLFPINTIVAVAVYLISQPWFQKMLGVGLAVASVAGGAVGRAARLASRFGGLTPQASGRGPAEEYA